MNKVVAGAIVGCLLGAGVASPALAANVYDLNHHLVGELVGQAPDGSTLVKVNLGGHTNLVKLGVMLPFNDGSPVYFASANCGGQALIPFDWTKEVIPTAVWDGTHMWIGNSGQGANYFTASQMVGGVCTNLGPNAAAKSTGASPVSWPYSLNADFFTVR
jgi:hypothetical protein